MQRRAEFCVVYRFTVRSGAEGSFKLGWTRLTEAIRDQRGGLGSRLHRGDDGVWVAYAQWPDRETWQRSQDAQAPDAEAERMMSEAIEERFPPLLLEPAIDLLVPCEAG